MDHLVVFGANGPSGRLVTERALADGHTVTAFTRRPDDFPALEGDLRVRGGDVFDGDAVDAAVAGADAVISTLGVPFGRQPISVYSAGTSNILEAMGRHGTKRLLCVSSSSVAPPPEPLGGVVFRKVLQPYVVNRLGRTLYDDMRRMEAIVAASAVDWTIVRPSGLFLAGEVTGYEVARDHLAHRFTAREDLADCLVRQVGDRTFVGGALAVATVDRSPGIVQLIWREGIRKR
jgi:nucleoside-diphosphate-sugar epimerase